jgi:signal transduction histidine kinase
MQADLRDGDYEEVSENLQKIGTLSTRLESLIGDIEETARIDAENDKAEEVDITQKINGEISLQSTSEGTTFKIILPILKAMPS